MQHRKFILQTIVCFFILTGAKAQCVNVARTLSAIIPATDIEVKRVCTWGPGPKLIASNFSINSSADTIILKLYYAIPSAINLAGGGSIDTLNVNDMPNFLYNIKIHVFDSRMSIVNNVATPTDTTYQSSIYINRCQLSTSLSPISNSFTRLWPNPVREQLHFTTGQAVQHAVVYNMQGQVIRTVQQEEELKSISTSGLPAVSLIKAPPTLP